MLKHEHTLDGFPVSELTHGSEKKVILICDSCGKESIAIFHNYTSRQKSVGWTGKTFCRGCSNKESGIAKRGKPIKKSGPRPNVFGDKHHSWTGGRFISSDGYWVVYVGPRHHRKEHLLLMEQKVGRSLRSGEVVHHVDLDKLNNKPENLVLFPSEKEHRAAHGSLTELAANLVRMGLIEYREESATYVAVGKLRELLEQPAARANQQPSRDGNASEGSTTRCESP